MIRNSTVHIPVKDLMNSVYQLAAMRRYGRDVITAASDFLRSDPSACTKIAQDRRRVFLRSLSAGNLLSDVINTPSTLT